MYNSIASQDFGRARQRQLLDEAATRRFRRIRRTDRQATGRDRSVPGSGAGRTLVNPA
jgi:hypothetical protein